MMSEELAGGLRVAYLIKRFPRLSETFILNEILELKRVGLALQLYALLDPQEKQVHPEAAALRHEVIYLHYPGRRLRSWRRLLSGTVRQGLSHPVGALRVLWALASVHRSVPSLRHAIEGMWLANDLGRRGVTHLHAHFVHSPGSVAFFARLAGGPPFSVTAHAKDLYTTLPRNLRIRGHAADFLVTCTAANARYLRELLNGDAAQRIHVLHHGVDLQRFVPIRSIVPGRILSVGRLVPKKGFAELIAALHLLSRQDQGFDAEIFGGGPLHDELLQQAQADGLAERIRFHGARTQDSIIRAYRRAAIFVLAPVITDRGDRDGIPNVLVEAMASGVPVVSTRISGIPELITDGADGLLVEPHDPAALALAMARVLTDPDFAGRLSRAGRRKVERLFDIRTTTDRLHGLLTGSGIGEPSTDADAEAVAA